MGTEYEFLHGTVKDDVAKTIEQLPYQFKYPHKFDKKTDPRKSEVIQRVDGKTDRHQERTLHTLTKRSAI